MYTARQKRQALERELTFRRRVFPRMVDRGQMSKATADEQIAIFEEIKADYEAAEAKERLL